MKKLKRKLGLLYWKLVGKGKTALYKLRKLARSWGVWLRGWFMADRKGIAAMEQAETAVVCAHPDDETIFFSSVVKQEKPFVVCVSHRGNAERKKEFYNALGHWGVDGIMLNFPDVPGLTWVWRRRMKARLGRLRRKMPAVTSVYTHSGSGESGHLHHYAVHDGVKKVFSDCKIYTTARKIPENGAGRLCEAAVEEKYDVIRRCYPSQIEMLETWCPWWQAYVNTEFFEE